MDPALHDKLRSRIRQVIAEKAGLRPVKGGFLPLLAAAAPIVAPVVSGLIGKLFGNGEGEVDGEGKYWSHKADAKTRKPNAHAQKVKEIMAYYKANGAPLSLGAASKMAKAELAGKPAPKPRKAGKSRARKSKKNDD